MMAGKRASIAKITCPKVSGIFLRKRLFRLLDTCHKCPATWVSGPAGSGKTTLVASYLGSRVLPCLWYQLDEGDSDIAAFFYYMGLAAKEASPETRRPLPLLTPEYLSAIPLFTRRYFEDLYSRLLGRQRSRRGGKGKGKKGIEFIVVFDNYQDVPVRSAFHEMIVHGLEVIPEGLRVLVLSRNEPPPPLARLCANNRISFLGWNDIRLTLEESREIVRIKGEKRLSDETLRYLHEKTDGWIAGLMLLVLQARIKGLDYESLVKFVPREVLDYLGNEIFEKTDKDLQMFLLKTAFLPRMTVRMAEKLTGVSASGRILNDLSENHYFTEKYSSDNPVYQYHPLFREFLLARAQSLFSHEEISSIQRSAARSLEDSGQLEDAAALFRDGEAWDELTRLVLHQAPVLVSQGRCQTLQDWVSSIPGEIEDRPWLLYWLAVCKQPFNLAEAGNLFERAFRLFQAQKDLTGVYLAWAGVIDTILLEGSNFTSLDRWVEWLDKQALRRPSFPSRDIEARVATGMAGALTWRQPQHPDIRTWIERSLALSRDTEDVNLRLQANLYALNYYSWTGDLPHCSMVTDEIRKMARLPTASPLMVLTWKWIEALIHNRSSESYPLSLQSISEGLKIADETGVHVWDHMLFAQGVYASLNKRDMAMAAGFLKKMEAALENSRRYGFFQYHYLTAWHTLLTTDVSRAFLSAETALQSADSTGMVFAKILCGLLMAQVLYEKKDYRKAAGQLSAANDLARASRSLMLQYLCLLKEAEFSLDRNDETAGLDVLRRAMALGKEQGYGSLFPWWQPSAMARLCGKALETRIEVDYTRDMIRKHHLVPEDPPFEIENWPWPLKIYTFGSFKIIRDGEPIKFPRKVQQKPLLLLKALIALGRSDIKEERLTDLLWPEADGDAAHSAFTTTLSRLRQLIGVEKAVTFQEGRAALDPHYCWVDAWAFENIVEKVEATLMRPDEAENKGRGQDSKRISRKHTLRLAEKAIATYKGHFLPADEAQSWTALYSERLRTRFLRFILRVGHHLEEALLWEKAAEIYDRGLETDDLAEELYQHLMICYEKLGQHGKAIELYQRLKKIFSMALGIEVSPKTEAIYKTLRGNLTAKVRVKVEAKA